MDKEEFWKILKEPTKRNCKNCKHLDRFVNLGMGSCGISCYGLGGDKPKLDIFCRSISHPMPSDYRLTLDDHWEWDRKNG